jgi:hypothetical protein
MNASPITTWEGAEAYFTFADQPAVVILILVAAVAFTVYAIISAFVHESDSYQDYM